MYRQTVLVGMYSPGEVNGFKKFRGKIAITQLISALGNLKRQKMIEDTANWKGPLIGKLSIAEGGEFGRLILDGTGFDHLVSPDYNWSLKLQPIINR